MGSFSLGLCLLSILSAQQVIWHPGGPKVWVTLDELKLRLTFGFWIFLVNLYIYEFSDTWLSAFHGFPTELLELAFEKIETVIHNHRCTALACCLLLVSDCEATLFCDCLCICCLTNWKAEAGAFSFFIFPVWHYLLCK